MKVQSLLTGLLIITVTPCSQMSKFNWVIDFVVKLVTSNRIKTLNVHLSSNCFNRNLDLSVNALQALNSYNAAHRLEVEANSAIPIMAEVDHRSQKFTRRTVHFICANLSQVTRITNGRSVVDYFLFYQQPQPEIFKSILPNPSVLSLRHELETAIQSDCNLQLFSVCFYCNNGHSSFIT